MTVSCRNLAVELHSKPFPGPANDAGRTVRAGDAVVVFSYPESVFELDEALPNRIGFALENMLRIAHRIDYFSYTYYLNDSLKQLLALYRINFVPLSQRVQSRPGHLLRIVQASDAVTTRNTGRHHTAKRQFREIVNFRRRHPEFLMRNQRVGRYFHPCPSFASSSPDQLLHDHD